MALTYLKKAGKVDDQRVLVLRTGSNYSMPPPGVSAADNMQKENAGYSALGPSVEAAYKVGSTVVMELLAKWSVYRDHLPPFSDSRRRRHQQIERHPVELRHIHFEHDLAPSVRPSPGASAAVQLNESP